MVWLVVPAAGAGTRFGAVRPKQFAAFRGSTLLGYTLARVLRHPAVLGAMVALPEGETVALPEAVDGKPVWTCLGAAHRAGSVAAALRALHERGCRSDWVLVHDAVRPCVRRADLEALLAGRTPTADGVILAAPVSDTVKRVVGSAVVETVPRQELWRALTPQLLRWEALTEALARLQPQAGEITDEAMALERIGGRVEIVRGASDNLKITQPGDLGLAEWICAAIEAEEGS